MTERVRLAYNVLRDGIRKDRPPEWESLQPWMRDAMLVTYLQGKLDWGASVAARADGEQPRAEKSDNQEG